MSTKSKPTAAQKRLNLCSCKVCREERAKLGILADKPDAGASAQKRLEARLRYRFNTDWKYCYGPELCSAAEKRKVWKSFLAVARRRKR